MLPSFFRRRYDSDEGTGRHAYTPLENADESKEFKSLVDEVEGDSSLREEEQSFSNQTKREDVTRRVLKALALLVPSFLEPKRPEAKPLRSTAWLGNAHHTGYFRQKGLTCYYRRPTRNRSIMCRTCPRRPGMVLMGHPDGMDT